MFRKLVFLLIILILNLFYSTRSMADNLTSKAGCIKAAIQGIKLEMERNEKWTASAEDRRDVKAIAEYKNELSTLENDLMKYSGLTAADYQLPERFKVAAWVEGQCAANAILYMKDMSQSGPWYHVAGIAGDEYNSIEPGKKYSMDLYLVYPREYFGMKSYYVYINSAERDPVSPGKVAGK